MNALIVGTARDIFAHKLLMLRALLIGLIAAIITGQLFVLPLMRWLLPDGMGGANGWFSGFLFCTVWAPIHGAHGALVGWIIARSHREHRAAALIVFIASGLPAVVPELFRLAMNQSPTFFPILAQTFFPVACLLLSGLTLVQDGPAKAGPYRWSDDRRWPIDDGRSTMADRRWPIDDGRSTISHQTSAPTPSTLRLPRARP